MIDKDELESRLKGWADEYGGGKYEHVGWHSRNLIQTLVEHKGFVPSARGFIPVPIRSAADEVEQIVRGMEAGDWYKLAEVLRCDYFQPNWSIDMRLRAMKKVGLPMSRAGYYDILLQAKAAAACALSKRIAA